MRPKKEDHFEFEEKMCTGKNQKARKSIEKRAKYILIDLANISDVEAWMVFLTIKQCLTTML